MIPFSVLDLAPVPEGLSTGRALRNSIDLAVHVERLGYKRYWMAEHHSMAGVASAATAVCLAHAAEATSTIRIGAGGIMLPNWAPLQVAEQFGTLAALHPGRIDLGLGRAPGTDMAAMRALRRGLAQGADQFPQDVLELKDYFAGNTGRPVTAVPGEGEDVPIWILGSSLYGAQLAAMLGLPYAFASHFAPQAMHEAIRVYRDTFKPSDQLAEPYVMLGYNVFAADTDEEAELLATSMAQTFVALRTGRPGKLQPPVAGYRESLGPMEQAILQQTFTCSAIGSPETVRQQVEAFVAETGVDELMITSQIFDHEARKRSYALLSEVFTPVSAAA